jgi:hypothetical protein
LTCEAVLVVLRSTLSGNLIECQFGQVVSVRPLIKLNIAPSAQDINSMPKYILSKSNPILKVKLGGSASAAPHMIGSTSYTGFSAAQHLLLPPRIRRLRRHLRQGQRYITTSAPRWAPSPSPSPPPRPGSAATCRPTGTSLYFRISQCAMWCEFTDEICLVFE